MRLAGLPACWLYGLLSAALFASPTSAADAAAPAKRRPNIVFIWPTIWAMATWAATDRRKSHAECRPAGGRGHAVHLDVCGLQRLRLRRAAC